MKRIAIYCIATAILFGSDTAFADNNIQGSPASWRLQNYVGGLVSIYYSGSTCTNGLLNLPASSSADERNRLWSLVMTAKATGSTVGIFYETTSGNCNITSFYYPP
jgi:hypothetical protein